MTDKQTLSQQYTKWKTAIPFLYDWFANHNLTWPSLSCRWGAEVSDSPFRRTQYLYLSERTDASEPNKLMLVPAELCKPRVAAAHSISGFHEKSKSIYIQNPKKTILHQGEVNKIREVPGHPSIVATHSDASEVFIWHFDRQQDRSMRDAEAPGGAKSSRCAQKDDWHRLSEPDVRLVGHTDIAEFALATTSAAPLVASGGKDTNVLVWNLQDIDKGGLLIRAHKSSPYKSPQLSSFTTLRGHKNTVGDVGFQPESSVELGSVGDDCAVLLWDTRSGQSPVATISGAHKEAELRCIDWSARNKDLIATGAEDGSLKIWDRRRLDAALHSFELHTRSLVRVEWSSYRPGVLASGGEDGVVCIWDLARKSNGSEAVQEGIKFRGVVPPELLFQHAGHQAGQVADFQWHPTDPFTIVSVSDDPEGGTLQLWRVNDLIYRPEAEVLMELDKFSIKIKFPQFPSSLHQNLEVYRDEILPREKQPRKPDGDGRLDAPDFVAKAEAEPPMSTGGGSAPAATPAGAFVGVPEGVPVSAAEEAPASMA